MGQPRATPWGADDIRIRLAPKGRYGESTRQCRPFRANELCAKSVPRALPWAVTFRPFGADGDWSILGSAQELSIMFRRQTTVCREGWYYLAILALVFGGAISKEVNLLLILAGMLLGPTAAELAGRAHHAARAEDRTPIAVAALGRRPALGQSQPDQHPAAAGELGGRGRGADPAGVYRGRGQQQPSPPAAAAPQRAVSLRARRASRGKASTAAGCPSAAAIASGPCGFPRGFPSGCFRGRSPRASRRR